VPYEPFPASAPHTADNWINYAVPSLERILADDLHAGFDRALAWGRVGSLISAAMEVLIAAREDLIRVWVVEFSSAALRFTGEVDNLHTQMQQISDASFSNKPTLVRALESFESSRSEIMKLANEWSFNAIQEKGSVVGDSAVASTTVRDWRQVLNDRAHQYLQASDQAAFEESQALQVPDDFRTGILDTFGASKPPDGIGPGYAVPGNGATGAKLTKGSINAGGIGEPVVGQSPIPTQHPMPHGVAPGDGFVSEGGEAGSAMPVVGPVRRYITDPDLDGSTARSRPTDSYDRAHGSELGGNHPVDAMPMVGGIGPTASDKARTRRRRSSQPARWQTLGGIPGVLLPANVEAVHDPGPGVLGIDR